MRVERDFSYGARAYAGDRWIVVGDAGSFLDPVFSTGVAIASRVIMVFSMVLVRASSSLG